MIERRLKRRSQAEVHGRIVAGIFEDPCLIIDISDDGARLRVGPSIYIPEKFYLRSPEFDMVMPSSLVWRKGNEVGARF